MENPYEYDRTALPLRSQATQRLMCRAWEEGDANGDERGYARGRADRYEQIKRQRAELDSQKQIVSELAGALQGLIDEYWCNMNSNSGFIACITPTGIPLYWWRARNAIAKATGI